jgi:phospholipid/cholesterol/gamma-HCH transport system substrate-binding protein
MVRRNFAEVLTGLVVLIVAAGFLVYAIANSGRAAIGDGYPLYAQFNNIAGLTVGSDVRLAGVKIGAVESETINPKTFLAEVRMSIRHGVELPKDSSVEVASESLLGGVYLAVQPGGDTQILQPGQTITITQGAVSLQDLLGKFIFSATNMVNAMTGSAKSGSPAQSGQAGSGAQQP